MNPDTPALVVGPAAGLGQSVPRRDDNADEKGGRNRREVLLGPSPSRFGRRGRLHLVWLRPFAACALALSVLAVVGSVRPATLPAPRLCRRHHRPIRRLPRPRPRTRLGKSRCATPETSSRPR